MIEKLNFNKTMHWFRFSQFECSNTKKNEQMINLNIKTLANLTHLFLTYNKDTNEKYIY